MKTKVLLVGPVLTRSGYGEQARFAMRALRSREDLFDIYINPITWGQTSWIYEKNEEREWIDATVAKTAAYASQQGQFDVSLQVTIPNEWQAFAPKNIGYTAGIETTKAHHGWIEQINNMDNVLTISNFSKNTLESTVYQQADNPAAILKTTTNINVVHYPVKTYESTPDLDLNDLKYDTNFLVVAQWSPRKNLENTIKWFIEEFKDDEVGLVIKTNRAKNCLMDREICEGTLKGILGSTGIDRNDIKCNIVLLHGDMTDEEMHSLYKHDKISSFVTIAHGEGFGLPVFEAAYCGLPIVSVGWSGQLDFLTDENGKNQFYNVAFDINPVQPEVVWDGVLIAESAWAYAREDSFKNQLRKCYDDINNNTGFVASASEYATNIQERFEESKMYANFIESLGLELDVEWADKLSQIEIL